MALEIEHKFLVNSSAYRSLAKPVLYRQGYLAVLSDKIVRVRTAGTKAYITIKAKVSVLTRKEYEYEIPLADAETMLNEMCMGPLIEKYRYKIFYEGFVWEVDEFLGDNNGLVVAEIEVKSENQDFPIPLWVDTEVTGDPRYLNSNLSKKPFNTWNK
ncbi:MAG: CYTH domain-containing protein [Lentimicrobiaceae bacterium]|nr:CYTH domain-containing protein [Lentimicrobiaceae bacterium]